MTFRYSPWLCNFSENTSTLTVTEVLPKRSTLEKKLSKSPGVTGSLNTNSLTATVAKRPLTVRQAMTAPAKSTCAMTQPPKMSPLTLQSEGIGMMRMTNSWSSGRRLRVWWVVLALFLPAKVAFNVWVFMVFGERKRDWR